MRTINLKKSLEEALKARGLTRKELQKSLDYKSRSSLTNIIKNPRSVTMGVVDRIAEELGYEFWEFIKLGVNWEV